MSAPPHSLGQWPGIAQHLPAMDVAKITEEKDEETRALKHMSHEGSIRKVVKAMTVGEV